MHNKPYFDFFQFLIDNEVCDGDELLLVEKLKEISAEQYQLLGFGEFPIHLFYVVLTIVGLSAVKNMYAMDKQGTRDLIMSFVSSFAQSVVGITEDQLNGIFIPADRIIH